MYQLRKSFRFEASHQLVHHQGKCRRLHGHSYVLTIELSGGSLQKSGSSTNMLCDFQVVSSVIKPLLQTHLDHHHLNDTLETDSPTAEFIAKWVYDRVRPKLPNLDAVTVQETVTSVAVYRPRRGCCHCSCHDESGLVGRVPEFSVEQDTAQDINGEVEPSREVELNGNLHEQVERGKLHEVYEDGNGVTNNWKIAVKRGLETTTADVDHSS